MDHHHQTPICVLCTHSPGPLLVSLPPSVRLFSHQPQFIFDYLPPNHETRQCRVSPAPTDSPLRELLLNSQTCIVFVSTVSKQLLRGMRTPGTKAAAAASAADDHPCDLRLLVPDTCLKELVNDGQAVGGQPADDAHNSDDLVDGVRVEDDIEECEDEEDDDGDYDEHHQNDSIKFGGGDGLDEPIDIDSFGFEPLSRFFDIKPDVFGKGDHTGLISPLTPPPSADKKAVMVCRKTAKAKLNALAASLASPNPVTVGGAYKCKKCCNSYARLHSLNRHLRFECGVEPQFECPVCHKKSKHKHNLVLHMRTHRGAPIPKFT